MPDVELNASVPLPPERAFAVFVEEMNTWWPRQGVFPYSFAPPGTRPLHIRFEAHLGGRYYESFADGSEYTIGHIAAWQPPSQLAYSWRDPTWQGETMISLSFNASGHGTAVRYRQDGFAAAGAAGLIPYYQIGCQQTLAGYIAHCRALHDVEALNLSQE